MTSEGADESTGDGTELTAGVSRAAVNEPPTATAPQEQPESHLLDENLRTFPWLRAGAVALGTLAVEYVLVTLIFVLNPGSSVDLPELSDRLVQYGLVLYNAHHVPTRVTATDAEVFGASLVNALYNVPDPSIPPTVFFLIPPVSVLIAGALLEWHRGDDRSDSVFEEAALVGTGVGFGYVATGLIGSFVFTRSVLFDSGAEGQAGPAVLWLLIIMFLLPLIFAGLGALLFAVYEERLASV